MMLAYEVTWGAGWDKLAKELLLDEVVVSVDDATRENEVDSVPKPRCEEFYNE